MASTITGAAYDFQHAMLGSVQAVWTGTPTGSLQLQKSNDQTNWFNDGAAVAVSGAAGSNWWGISDAHAMYYRVVYTATSGAGALSLAFATKGV